MLFVILSTWLFLKNLMDVVWRPGMELLPTPW
jgi:hypothetical protein